MQKEKNQYNIRKAKLTIYVKNNMPWSHKIYAGNAKLFLHSNINQCNSRINIIKKKNIMILSLEVEIAFDRIQNLVMILKKPHRARIERNIHLTEDVYNYHHKY